ncbi:MAG TPA: hypothetical protein VN963_07960 [bacterium]|jgi:hypothetical protein|nr:hypothetical protein [bacterium]
MIDKLMSKINQWFNEPLGDTGAVPDEKDNELKKPKRSFGGTKQDFVEKKSQPDLRLVPRRIEEFHPRGSAGRREARGPKGSHKASMPNHGNRSKNPK